MKDLKTELYILSGFLGSGKTTLLQHLLEAEQKAGRKIAVIMNELGKVSIDSDKIPKQTPLKELLDGCVCCSIQGQLEVQLHSMLQQYELDAIYIETTGVAHPIEVLDTCMSPLFADQLHINGIISLLDAKRWKDKSKLNKRLQKLLLEQIIHADVILLNKLDGLTEEEKASVLFEIQSYNSNSRVIMTEFAKVNPKDIKNVNLSPKGKHEKTDVNETLHLKTFVYQFSKPISRSAFEDWLRQTPENIYRIKGYMKFTDSPSLFSFQYSYGVPLYLQEMMELPMNLVFIGENINHEEMEKQLSKIEATE